MRQLSGQDASFIYQEQPHAPLNGASLNIYDQSTARGGRVTFRGILQDIERRLHLAPVLRERLVRVPAGVTDSRCSGPSLRPTP